MSMPALKPRPSARRITTRTESSRPYDSNASAISNHSAIFGALTGGASTMTSAMPSLTLRSIATSDPHRVLSGRVATIDHEVGTGAVRALVRCQEDHQRRDFVRVADPFDRVAFVEGVQFVAFLVERVPHLGVDPAGTDGVHADVVLAEL